VLCRRSTELNLSAHRLLASDPSLRTGSSVPARWCSTATGQFPSTRRWIVISNVLLTFKDSDQITRLFKHYWRMLLTNSRPNAKFRLPWEDRNEPPLNSRVRAAHLAGAVLQLVLADAAKGQRNKEAYRIPISR
jgi:hypothetical protein